MRIRYETEIKGANSIPHNRDWTHSILINWICSILIRTYRKICIYIDTRWQCVWMMRSACSNYKHTKDPRFSTLIIISLVSCFFDSGFSSWIDFVTFLPSTRTWLLNWIIKLPYLYYFARANKMWRRRDRFAIEQLHFISWMNFQKVLRIWRQCTRSPSVAL